MSDEQVRRAKAGQGAADNYRDYPAARPCRCHADGYLYGSLVTCPSCGHRSFDPTAEACERRRCESARRGQT